MNLKFIIYSRARNFYSQPVKLLLIKTNLILLFAIPVIADWQFKTYNAGQSFTCIAVDSNYNIWAGTNKTGLYMLNKKSNVGASQFTITPSASTVNIQTLAADRVNVWVGHSGINSTYGGGGIERVNMNNPATAVHFSADRNAECFTFLARDGIPTLSSASITVDKNGTIWSAHKYHDLTVAGGGGTAAQYILTPGSLAYMPSYRATFISKGTYNDYRNGADAPELPYPAYTCSPSVSQTAQSRNCYSVACGDKEVWVSVAAYQAKNGQSFPARLIRYNLGGTFIGVFNFKDVGIPAGGIFNNIYITAQGKVWVTTTLGRMSYFDGSYWHPINFPGTFPASIRANANAITGDKFGNVYIGTNSGFVVCNANPLSTKSSYTLYTVAQGLPSSNVTGIAAEKNGTVWMSTDAGIAAFSPPAFAVYNLINPIEKDEINAEKFQLVSADSKDLQINGRPIEINVAADSSKSTLIVYNGASPETKEITLVGTSVGNDPYSPETGQFKELLRNKDSLVYLYRHPNYVLLGAGEKFVTFSIGLRDKNTAVYAVQGKLNVYHPPVLLVHGVWSSVSSMDLIKDYLKKSSIYDDYQLLGIWYNTSNHDEAVYSVQRYRNQIPNGIDRLLQQCRENFVSAGRVNIIGHSRGGLFARYYLQNTFDDFPYRKDINSLITVNSPHLGAQTADLILDKRKILGLVEVGQLLSKAFLNNPERPQGDDISGAYELRVKDHAIVNTLNGTGYLNANVVPSHAIVSQYKFGLSRADIVKSGIVGGAVPLFLRIYALTLGTACLEGAVDDCLKEIFTGDANDVVVPLTSQKGGLEDRAVSLLKGNFGHSRKNVALLGVGVIDVPAVTLQLETHEKILELLKQNPNVESSNFTKNGFHPGSPLQYTFLPNLPGNPSTGRTDNSQSTLSIDASIKGKTYKPGDTLQIAVNGSSDIKTLLTAYSSPSLAEPSSDVGTRSSVAFKYLVPKEASGKLVIIAYGFNDNGLVAIDSSFINVGVPTNVTLDSIRFQKSESNILVPAKDSMSLTILGYYSDTVRQITYLPGIAYSFLAGGIASTSSSSYLLGILPGGFDQLKVSYLGKTDSANVQVTDSIPSLTSSLTLPVNFESFTGEYKNKQVQLIWATAQEKNNKQFEVQYSDNTVEYETIGVVPGKGNTSSLSSYFYPTSKFKPGKNYYRLKQVDLDGNYKFSAAVMVSVNEVKQASISIYPNPASNAIILNIRQQISNSVQLQLTDIAGHQVWLRTVRGNSNSVPFTLPQLAKGMYVVTIVNDKGEKLLTDKLIIQ